MWMMLLAAAGPGAAEESAVGQAATSGEPTASPSAPAASEAPVTAAAATAEQGSTEAQQAARLQEEGLRAQLNGTTWLLHLVPLYGSSAPKVQDTITFTNREIRSERLTKAGYPPTNYTLTIGGDGVPFWETMQSNTAEGVIFWRGELRGRAMQGVLSQHPLQGSSQDYSFVGENITAGAAPAEAAGSPSADQPSTEASGASGEAVVEDPAAPSADPAPQTTSTPAVENGPAAVPATPAAGPQKPAKKKKGWLF